MALALICSQSVLDDELGQTPLGRSGIERQRASRLEEARVMAVAARPDIVVVDREMPRAGQLVAALRGDTATRGVSIAVLARGDFEPSDVDLLAAGANAIFRLPAGPDWEERLQRLLEVPVRRDTRLPVTVRVEAFAGGAQPVAGTTLNLSANGMLLSCEFPLRVGDELLLELARRQEDEEAVRLGGRVVREAGGRRFGVHFEEIPPSARDRLRRLVEPGTAALDQ